MADSNKDDDDDYFYTAKITLRNGKVLYAHQVGLRAFRIPKKKSESNKASSKKQ